LGNLIFLPKTWIRMFLLQIEIVILKISFYNFNSLNNHFLSLTYSNKFRFIVLTARMRSEYIYIYSKQHRENKQQQIITSIPQKFVLKIILNMFNFVVNFFSNWTNNIEDLIYYLTDVWSSTLGEKNRNPKNQWIRTTCW
jgi:hypothetical protein